MKTEIVTVRLELAQPRALSFYEITLDRKKVITRDGVVMADGAVRNRFAETERFATELEAQQRFDAQILRLQANFKQTARTVREVEDPEQKPHRHAANPELESRVGTANESSVFADWLQSNGDVRGELAALHHRGESERAERFFEANLAALFGSLELQVDRYARDLRWRDGFLVGATLKTEFESTVALEALTAQFLALPIARFVTELRFGLAGYETNNDWGPTMNAVTSWEHAGQITGLFFNAYDSEECELSWVAFGDLSNAWSKLPALQTLHIRSGEGGTLGSLELPKLKTFIRESGGLQAHELESIIGAQWPMLEHLDVWFGQATYGGAGTVEHAMRIVANAPPSLRHLGIINAEFLPALIAPLAASPVLRRLAVLDLSKGTLVDADVDLLIVHRAAYQHLQRVEVSDNLINTRGAELQAALPNVMLGKQRYGEYANEEHRYSAVGE